MSIQNILQPNNLTIYADNASIDTLNVTDKILTTNIQFVDSNALLTEYKKYVGNDLAVTGLDTVTPVFATYRAARIGDIVTLSITVPRRPVLVGSAITVAAVPSDVRPVVNITFLYPGHEDVLPPPKSFTGYGQLATTGVLTLYYDGSGVGYPGNIGGIEPTDFYISLSYVV